MRALKPTSNRGSQAPRGDGRRVARDRHLQRVRQRHGRACASANAILHDAWPSRRRVEESPRDRESGVRRFTRGVKAAGTAIGSKYSAAFILGVVALAHLVNPRRPRTWTDGRGWLEWTARGMSPLLPSSVVFAVVDPMAVIYSAKFLQDVQEQIIDPVVTGAVRPIFMAQFTDVQPQWYWFTTNLWWSFGPTLEVWGLLGIVCLVWRRTRTTLLAAAFPLLYFLTAGGTRAPMARYTLPLAPAFAVAAGAFSAFLFDRPRWRRSAIVVTGVVVATTALYALAYMNIYRSPDARLAASSYLQSTVPKGSRILVEPSHSVPPTGSYLQSPNFYGDYVMWGARRERHDYYSMYTLDTYAFLYGQRATSAEKRDDILSRLDLVDYIVIDDFYTQLYRHLPDAEYAVVKRYYDEPFGGQIGFDLAGTFKVYPSLFGVPINDDAAELSSRMNDHPRVHVFVRRHSRTHS